MLKVWLESEGGEVFPCLNYFEARDIKLLHNKSFFFSEHIRRNSYNPFRISIRDYQDALNSRGPFYLFFIVKKSTLHRPRIEPGLYCQKIDNLKGNIKESRFKNNRGVISFEPNSFVFMSDLRDIESKNSKQRIWLLLKYISFTNDLSRAKRAANKILQMGYGAGLNG